jgi:hypothetical protein
MTQPQYLLSMLFDMWKPIADETTRCLGEETASLFVYLYLDAVEIHHAIGTAYPREECSLSLILFDHMAVWKELHWLHALFLFGNYPLVLTRLRFNWERIFRARYADAYGSENPGAADPPGPTLDDKHDWLTQREDKLNWKTLIARILRCLFAESFPGEMEAQFKPLWDRLNRCVHPSGDLRGKLVGDTGLIAVDAFDEAWARETLADAAEVFAVVWLAVLSRFPAAVPALLADPERFRACPQLRAALTASRQP